MAVLVFSLVLAGQPRAPASHFNWGDAAIGAVTAAGVLLLLLGGALVFLQARGASRPGPPGP